MSGFRTSGQSNEAIRAQDPDFEQLNRMLAQREILEIEADAIGNELRSPGPNGEPPAGLKDPLVDAEGYPRADVDIYRVRGQRKRLAEINTDYRKLMDEINVETKRVQALRAAQAEPLPEADDAEVQRVDDGSVKSHSNLGVIAIIDEILDGSPASEAGLVDGDELLAFGPVTTLASADPMSAIPAVVKDGVGRPIKLVVRRGEVQEKYLVPKAWGGRGLLGCHLSKAE